MCSMTNLNIWLGIALAFLLGSAGLVIAAIAVNSSIVGAFASQGLMDAAGIVATLAVIALATALITLISFCKCLKGRCAGQCSNLRNVILAAMTVLAIQAVLCFLPAGASMYAILGAMVVQVALIISAIAFGVSLSNCAESAGGSPAGGSGGSPTGGRGGTSPV